MPFMSNHARRKTYPVQLHGDEGSETMFLSWQGELGMYKTNSLSSRILFTCLDEDSYYVDEHGVH